MTQPAIPEANGIECQDCPGFGNYTEGVTECPVDHEHIVTPVYITEEPLGRDDDADNLVHGEGTYYAYDAG